MLTKTALDAVIASKLAAELKNESIVIDGGDGLYRSLNTGETPFTKTYKKSDKSQLIPNITHPPTHVQTHTR